MGSKLTKSCMFYAFQKPFPTSPEINPATPPSDVNGKTPSIILLLLTRLRKIYHESAQINGMERMLTTACIAGNPRISR